MCDNNNYPEFAEWFDPDPPYGHSPEDGHRYAPDENGVCRHPGCGWWDKLVCPICDRDWEQHSVPQLESCIAKLTTHVLFALIDAFLIAGRADGGRGLFQPGTNQTYN